MSSDESSADMACQQPSGRKIERKRAREKHFTLLCLSMHTICPTLQIMKIDVIRFIFRCFNNTHAFKKASKNYSKSVKKLVRSEFLTEIMKMAVVCNIAPCRLVDFNDVSEKFAASIIMVITRCNI
jgi:hypothetical protein